MHAYLISLYCLVCFWCVRFCDFLLYFPNSLKCMHGLVLMQYCHYCHIAIIIPTLLLLLLLILLLLLLVIIVFGIALYNNFVCTYVLTTGS